MLILCSNSKVRAKLLQDAKIEFIQKSCEFDEDSITTKEPLLFVKEATEGKFRECLKCFDSDVLCADTIITDGKTLIRKPKDIDEARKLLQSLKGKNIIGGDVACLMPTKDHPNQITSMVASAVMFEIISLISININK